LQPLLKLVSQSTSCCPDKEVRFPVTIWFMLSTVATVENAQQLSQEPWFFTGVTGPYFLQSTDLGKSTASL